MQVEHDVHRKEVEHDSPRKIFFNGDKLKGSSANLLISCQESIGKWLALTWVVDDMH